MNYTKYMLLIACGLMMNMCGIVKGMEDMIAAKNSERVIASDHIFVWSKKDLDYHAITEEGEISERLIPKNDFAKKIYRTQLIYKEDGKHLLRTTQELIYYYTGPKYTNLTKHQRVLIPISFSEKQGQGMWEEFHRVNKDEKNNKEIILAMDNEDNVYFITHVYDAKVDNSKKAVVFDMKKFAYVQVPLLSKKKAGVKMSTLEQEFSELKENSEALKMSIKQLHGLIEKQENSKKQESVDLLHSSEDLKKSMDRHNRNIFIGKATYYFSWAALIAFLLYNRDQIAAYFTY
jgi:hypothetical protein